MRLQKWIENILREQGVFSSVIVKKSKSMLPVKSYPVISQRLISEENERSP